MHKSVLRGNAPVEDHDPLLGMGVQHRQRRESHVRKEAEAGGGARARVVAGWTHHGKGAREGALARGDPGDRGEKGT